MEPVIVSILSLPRRSPSNGRARRTASVLIAATLVMSMTSAPVSADDTDSPPVAVIVRGVDTIPGIVTSLGGSITSELPLIDGYAVTVPQDQLTLLAGFAGVTAVTPDETVSLLSDGAGWDDDTAPFRPAKRI